MASFQSLFAPDPVAQSASSEALNDDFQAEEDRAAKRARSSYTVHVGPKFRDEHITPYRATNLHVVKAESNQNEQSLFEYVLEDVNSGTIRAHSDLDILLQDYVHPQSPKMISMLLKHMNPDGEIDSTLQDMPVPLYLCLTERNIEDILKQLGLSGTDDISFISMNKHLSKPNNPKKNEINLEQFINECVGKMSRYNTNVDSSWDAQNRFYQPIRFKIRVGPQKLMVKSTKNIRRGNKGKTRKYGPKDNEDKQYDYQDDQFKPTNPKSDRDKMLDEAREDGQFYASTVQHPFEMTSHTAMSPQFRAAINQAGTYFEKEFKTKEDLKPFITGVNRAHFASIIESELMESETSLRTYRDPTANTELKKKKIFAIYSIKKNL